VSHTVLSLSTVGKRYSVFESNFLRFLGWFGANVQPKEEFWALRGISFDLRAGESIGVIGQNGAGKSTLLKLVSGTVRPSEGSISTKGRISAILELGLGFNPAFTGRQNVTLTAGLMGFSSQEITEITPGIEAFAELGEFFDRPLRVYSSGMQARLAFSVATAVRPEVLIVDEVLAVGDSYFQHKSFDRIRQFKDAGTALLLVTHSMGDVRTLCDRVILLAKGRVIKDGLPDEVTDYYHALIAEIENAKLSLEQKRNKEGWLVTRSGSGEAVVEAMVLLDAATRSPVATARVGQKLCLATRVKVQEHIGSLVIGYMLRDRMGHIVWGTNTWHTGQRLSGVQRGQTVTYDLYFTCTLGPGSYSFSPALVSTETHLVNNYEWTDNALVFDVMNADRTLFAGSSWLDAEIQVKLGEPA